MRRCFTDGHFEIDNGKPSAFCASPAWAENLISFFRLAEAAEGLAGAYTLVQSCRRLGFPARNYLIDLLQKFEAGWPLRRIRELVPDRWALEHRGLIPAAQTQQ